MKLDGVHHVTCITGEAPANRHFYVDVLGLRLVKKTVNQDVPTVYHLFYADEKGSAGSDLTFFEYPGATRGKAGAGMVHRISFRVAPDALPFWADRLGVEISEQSISFEDPEGLGLELQVDKSNDEPLTANHSGIPLEFAIRGFAGVRAFSSDPAASEELLTGTLGFRRAAVSYECRGDTRGSFYRYDATDSEGEQGAGTVHHVAWACSMDSQGDWRDRVARAGVNPTPIIDRFYFKSIYFREPSGVLFEIATLGPGFSADEPIDHLGERLSLPPKFEHLREELERKLTPL